MWYRSLGYPINGYMYTYKCMLVIFESIIQKPYYIYTHFEHTPNSISSEYELEKMII